MPREQFNYPETAGLLKTLDEAARRAGVSRGQCFEDFLLMSTAALSGGQLEEQYLQLVPRYSDGPQGRRAIDSVSTLFAQSIAAMEETRREVKDVLGDLYCGAITYGEHAQYYTPIAITDLMAELTTGCDADNPSRERRVCADPCCGSGRMLLSVAKQHPHWEFVGQDVDLRCVRLCAINMGLRNMYGYVVWGNSLSLEQKLVYRTGFNLNGGVIREVPLAACPAPVQSFAAEPTAAPPPASSGTSTTDDNSRQLRSITDGDSQSLNRQLRLF